ncbi:histone H3.v1-like [Solea solea]|uniref:histone H3.v1-like n=1 Tax=Solea solea TaxID=90069 RepID=UPI00272A1515|nr:histone H3.v1-like [Solea solea]
MTSTRESDLHEQHRGASRGDGNEKEEEEEGEEKVRVSVEGEQKEQAVDEEEEEEEGDKEELPYPSLAPVVLLALTQTSPPRSWCLRAVCHPYPSLPEARP